MFSRVSILALAVGLHSAAAFFSFLPKLSGGGGGALGRSTDGGVNLGVSGNLNIHFPAFQMPAGVQTAIQSAVESASAVPNPSAVVGAALSAAPKFAPQLDPSKVVSTALNAAQNAGAELDPNVSKYFPNGMNGVKAVINGGVQTVASSADAIGAASRGDIAGAAKSAADAAAYGVATKFGPEYIAALAGVDAANAGFNLAKPMLNGIGGGVGFGAIPVDALKGFFRLPNIGDFANFDFAKMINGNVLDFSKVPGFGGDFDPTKLLGDFSRVFSGAQFPGVGFPFPAIGSPVPSDVSDAIDSTIQSQNGEEVDPQTVVDSAVEANRQSAKPMSEDDAIAAALNAAHGAGADVEPNLEKYFPNGMNGVRATINNGASAIRSAFDGLRQICSGDFGGAANSALNAAAYGVAAKFGPELIAGLAAVDAANAGVNLAKPVIGNGIAGFPVAIGNRVAGFPAAANTAPMPALPNGVPNFGVRIPDPVMMAINNSIENLQFAGAEIDPQSIVDIAIGAFRSFPDSTDPNAIIAAALNAVSNAGVPLGDVSSYFPGGFPAIREVGSSPFKSIGNSSPFGSATNSGGFPNIAGDSAALPQFFQTFSSGLPKFDPANVFDLSKIPNFGGQIDPQEFAGEFSKFFGGAQFPGMGFPFPAIGSPVPADVMTAINREVQSEALSGGQVDPQTVVNTAVEANRQSAKPMSEDDAIAAALNAAHGAGADVEPNLEKYFPNGMNGVRATINNGASAIHSAFDAMRQSMGGDLGGAAKSALNAAAYAAAAKFGPELIAGLAAADAANAGVNLAKPVIGNGIAGFPGAANAAPMPTLPNGVPNFGVRIPDPVMMAINNSIENLQSAGAEIDPQSIVDVAIGAFRSFPDSTDPNAIIAAALNAVSNAGVPLGDVSSYFPGGFPMIGGFASRQFLPGFNAGESPNTSGYGFTLYQFPGFGDFKFPNFADFLKSSPTNDLPFPAIASIIPTDVMSAVVAKIKSSGDEPIDPQSVVESAIRANQQSEQPADESDVIAAALNAARGAGANIGTDLGKYFPNGMSGVKAVANSATQAVANAGNAVGQTMRGDLMGAANSAVNAAAYGAAVKFGPELIAGLAAVDAANAAVNLGRPFFNGALKAAIGDLDSGDRQKLDQPMSNGIPAVFAVDSVFNAIGPMDSYVDPAAIISAALRQFADIPTAQPAELIHAIMGAARDAGANFDTGSVRQFATDAVQRLQLAFPRATSSFNAASGNIGNTVTNMQAAAASAMSGDAASASNSLSDAAGAALAAKMQGDFMVPMAAMDTMDAAMGRPPAQ